MEEILTPTPEEPATPQETPELPETAMVVDIQFRPGQKIYFFDPDGITLNPGDHVIMDTARGAEFGVCTGGNHTISMKEVVAPLRKILRIATAQDEKVNEENRARERRAFEVCLQKIDQHKLDMQLVSAECAFDGSKILFYFTADERVDFRDLVKDLASVFHTRIELRQIGVRDKAKMVGGLGICGRPFCCASFLDDFQPVSIKMAKTQNLSLNPVKISGTCGRLMCCLKYEQDTYEDLIRSSPKTESLVDTPDGRGIVVESQILRGRVRVQMENDSSTFNVYSNDDIAVLRNGKAKKTDPPIPADYAPISGAGRKPRKSEAADRDTAPMLDPIRFKYSTEAIVEENAQAENTEPQAKPQRRPKPEPAPAEAAETPRPPRPRREQKPRPAPEQNAPAEPQAPRAEQPGAKAEQPRQEKQRPPKPRRDQKPRPAPEQQNAPAAGEKAEQPKQEQSNPEKQEHNRSARPRRDRRPHGPRPEQQNAPSGSEKPEQPKQENNQRRKPQPERKNAEGKEPAANQPAAEGEQKKPHHRGNYRHHHKPKPKQE